ncbi:hypothetical protein HS125_11960 [bacterium]|nr:hypothetical protein [bacterium]
MHVLWASLPAWIFLLLVSPIGLLALWPFLSARRAPAVLLAPVLGWGLLNYLLWMLGFLRLPYAATTIWILLSLLSGGSLAFLWLRRARLGRLWRAGRRFILAGIALFLVAHLYLALMRSARPDILGQEKFMDLAMFNSLYHHSVIPPLDPWLSGYRVNYYYGGYMAAATWAKAMGARSTLAYNVNLALLFALACLGAFAVAACFTRRLRWAVFAAVLVMLSGNLYAFYEIMILGKPLLGIDVWKASRVIVDPPPGNPDGNITEFPFFSYGEVADMHPHVMDVPLTFVAIFLCGVWLALGRREWMLQCRRTRTAALAVISGLWLAVMGWTNIFDLPSFGGLLFAVVFLARLADLRRARLSGLLLSGLIIAGVGVLSGLFLSPFLLTFTSPQSGPLVNWVPKRSDLGEYLAMWGLPLAISMVSFGVAVAAMLARVRYGRAQIGGVLGGMLLLVLVIVWMATGCLVYAALFAGALTILFLLYTQAFGRMETLAWGGLFFCLCVLLGCETLYIVDGYSPRYNTTFKFFYPVWIILGTLLPVLLAAALRRLRRRSQAGVVLVCAPLAILLAGSLLYPLSVTANRYKWRARPATLDGGRWLEQSMPADAGIARWLRDETPPGAVILERPGHLAYSRESRISTYAGRPAFIGWVGHEQVWRGPFGYSIAQPRAAVAQQIYSHPSLDAVWPQIVENRIQYIVVGTLEIETERDSRTGAPDRPYPRAGLEKFEREAARSSGARLKVAYEFLGPTGRPGGAGSGRIYQVLVGGTTP